MSGPAIRRIRRGSPTRLRTSGLLCCCSSIASGWTSSGQSEPSSESIGSTTRWRRAEVILSVLRCEQLGGRMAVCACGCGETTTRGLFKQGHDQKLRTRVEEREGGLVALTRLVDHAEEFA